MQPLRRNYFSFSHYGLSSEAEEIRQWAQDEHEKESKRA